jgi:hypothetical protein
MAILARFCHIFYVLFEQRAEAYQFTYLISETQLILIKFDVQGLY